MPCYHLIKFKEVQSVGLRGDKILLLFSLVVLFEVGCRSSAGKSVEVPLANLPALHDLPSNFLPTLSAPKVYCNPSDVNSSLGEVYAQEQQEAVLVPKSMTYSPTTRSFYGTLTGFYGRRNSFAPSSSRFGRDLFKTGDYSIAPIFRAVGRFLTPGVSRLSLYPKVLMETNEPRLLYPSSWIDSNPWIQNQKVPRRPGQILRTQECVWQETRSLEHQVKGIELVY
jgi:hypothetical protein